MRAYLILCFCLFSMWGNGQVWIGAEGFNPQIGERFILHTVEIPQGLDLSGPLIWDARSLVLVSSQAVNITDPSSNPYGPEFTGSSLCYALGGGNYLFSSHTEAGYFKHGGIAGRTGLIMADPELYFKFPLKKGSQWKDQFNSDFISQGIEFQRKGTVNGIVESQGNLIMPYGVVSDVLKVRLTEALTDTYLLQGMPMELSTKNEIICFLKAGNIEPLLTITHSYSQDVLTNSYGTYMDGSQVQNQGNTGPWRDIVIEKDADESLSIHFISERKGDLSVQLLDAKGVEIHSLDYIPVEPGPMRIPIPGFSGIRYLRLIAKGESTIVPLD